MLYEVITERFQRVVRQRTEVDCQRASWDATLGLRSRLFEVSRVGVDPDAADAEPLRNNFV